MSLTWFSFRPHDSDFCSGEQGTKWYGIAAGSAYGCQRGGG